MRPSSYIIGILVFTLFIVGGVSLMAEFRSSNPNFASDEKFSDFNQTFNVYDTTKSRIEDLGTSITDADSDFGVLGVLNGLILAAWQTLKLMLTNWAFMNTVFTGLATIFGIPTWIIGLIISAVTVMFVFAMFSAFFQREL